MLYTINTTVVNDFTNKDTSHYFELSSLVLTDPERLLYEVLMPVLSSLNVSGAHRIQLASSIEVADSAESGATVESLIEALRLMHQAMEEESKKFGYSPLVVVADIIRFLTTSATLLVIIDTSRNVHVLRKV